MLGAATLRGSLAGHPGRELRPEPAEGNGELDARQADEAPDQTDRVAKVGGRTGRAMWLSDLSESYGLPIRTSVALMTAIT